MKFLQYILLAFWFLLTNSSFAQKPDANWRDNLKIITKKSKQGVYNTKTKRFVIQPIYDRIYNNNEEVDIYECVKITGVWYDKDAKYETKYVIVDSNSNLLFAINSNYFSKYILVENTKIQKGIFDNIQSRYVTKIEFDTVIFLNGGNFGYKIYNFSPHSYSNYKPNKDLYAILGKKNTYQIFNVCQGKIDNNAFIIDVKGNPKVLYDYNSHDIYRNEYDSKLQVINLPDSNYEFDSSFYLFNSIKVNVLNTDIVKHHNKYGLYTYEEGKFYLPIEYDSILQERNYYKTFKNGKVGYAKRRNKNYWYNDSTNYNYTIITPESNIEAVVDFDEEIYKVKINGKWEFRNFSDNNRYDSIYIVDEKYTYNRKVFLKKDGKWSLNFMPYVGPSPRSIPPSKYLNKREKNDLNKVIRKQPCCGYEYQTHFLWDSIAIIYGDNPWYVAKQNDKILILNNGGNTQVKLEEKKVIKVGLEKIHGKLEFLYVVINKKFLFLNPYKVKMYLYNGKLVNKPKTSVYAKINRYVRVRKWKIKSYLRDRKVARQENRKLKEK